jgi:hypothetical protein
MERKFNRMKPSMARVGCSKTPSISEVITAKLRDWKHRWSLNGLQLAAHAFLLRSESKSPR